MQVVADIPALFAKEAPLPALVVEDGEAASPAVAPVLEAASPPPPRLETSSVNIDCCSPIASAVMVVWLSAVILSCWVHLARKLDDKIMNLNHQENHETIKVHVYALNAAVCEAQFAMLLACLSTYWTPTLDEPRYAKAFLTYDVGPDGSWRRNWFKTASGEPGVIPNSNPIESYNEKIKKVLGAHALYATLSYFFSESLPKIIIFGGRKIPPVGSVTHTTLVPINQALAAGAQERAASPAVMEVVNVPYHAIEGLRETLKLRDGSSVFLVNRGDNNTPITTTKANSFFDTMKPCSGGNAAVTEAKLKKLLEAAALYNVVAVTPTLIRGKTNSSPRF
jgi:hypothetical protein